MYNLKKFNYLILNMEIQIMYVGYIYISKRTYIRMLLENVNLENRERKAGHKEKMGKIHTS